MLRSIICFSLLYIAQNIQSECNFPTGNYIYQLNDPKSIQEISIEVPKSSKYNKNFAKIISSRSVNIPSDLKKNFKANLTIQYEFGSCTYKAKIRQHGDLRDHISFVDGKPSRSIKVSLESGNVFNAVKFRLLIPQTRNNLNEILGTVFLKELGFIAPETFQVKTKINNVESIMLFQEDIRKELLERNQRREGPVFEGDETLLWSYNDFELFELQHLALSRLTNPNWFLRGNSSKAITLASFQKIQKSYMEFTRRLPENKFTIFPNNKESTIFSDYFFIMLAMNGEHALNVNNRVYYHNSFSNQFEPIYYDGDLKLNKGFKLNKKLYLDTFDEDYTFPFTKLINNDAFVKKVYQSFIVRILNLEQDDDLFFNESIEKIKDNISKIQLEIRSLKKEVKREYTVEDLYENYKANEIGKKFIQNKITSIEKNTNDLYLVENSLGVQNYLTSDEISILISKNLYKNERSVYLPMDFIKNGNIKYTTTEEQFLNGTILYSKGIDIQADYNNKVIKIKQANSSDWILFRNNNLNDWKITFSGVVHVSTLVNGQRFNIAGMTGCLNFHNVNFNNVTIEVNKGQCEDSLNVVNSNGVIQEIRVSESFADAIDLDFSELLIKLIEINSAGNDCLDVSGGIYKVDLAKLNTCNDKGISVGEKSKFTISKIEIENSIIGVASKDSSLLEIDSGIFLDTKTCIDTYQKKQEFGGSIIKYKKIECDGNFKNDKNSSIIKI